MPHEPDIFVPWELFAGADPDSLTCRQGFEEFWLHEIWYPYWNGLTDAERARLLEAAPTREWKAWLEWRAEGADKTRADSGSPARALPADICRQAYDSLCPRTSPPRTGLRQLAAVLASLLRSCRQRCRTHSPAKREEHDRGPAVKK